MAGFIPAEASDSETTLILAGDISSKPDQLHRFLGECAARFERVLYVPGNHEFYRNHFQDWNKWLRDVIPRDGKVIAVGGDEVLKLEVDGVRFVLATLWGDGGRDMTETFNVQQHMNDFRLIRYGFRSFKVDDMKRENFDQQKKIEAALKSPTDCKTSVVITHHMPSYRLCHPRFGGDCDGGFACNMDSLLASDHAPDLWIHGHTHDTIDTTLWKTRVICNPRGYRGEWTSPHNRYSALLVDV